MTDRPPAAGSGDEPICGFVTHEMELLRAGDGDRALGRLRLALRWMEALDAASGDTDGARAEAAYEVGRGYDGVGDVANAEAWIARAQAMPAFRAGERWPSHCRDLSLRYLWRGDFERAEPLARESVAHARERRLSGPDALVGALDAHAETLLGLDRHAEAAVVAQEAVRLAQKSEWVQRFRAGYQATALMHLGQALAAVGRWYEAFAAFDQAEAVSAGWTTRTRLDVLLASAEARRAAGRADEAAERARLAAAWWDAVAATQRASGEDASAAERERDALSAAWAP
jgi:tetratricopeptide (TPR) repeat protein